MTTDDFKEHKLKILGDIQRLNELMIKLQDIVSLLTVEVAQLKVAEKIRASLWGGVGGIIAAIIITIIVGRVLPK